MSSVRLFLAYAIVAIMLIQSNFVAAAPGDVLWTASFSESISSSPVIGSDGTIYVASQDLHALNSSGQILWGYSPGHSIGCTPALRDDVLYTVCADLYAINTDGSLAWSYPLAEWGHNPAAIGADGTVYIGARDIYKVTAPGTLVGFYNSNRRINSPASLSADGTLYLSSYGNLIAIASDNTLKWSFPAGIRSETSPAIDGAGFLLITAENSLMRVSPDGVLDWEFVAPDVFDSSPSIGPDGTIYLGCNDGNLYALNADGTLQWVFATDAEVKSSPAVGQDGSVYVGSNDGYIYGIAATGIELWRVATVGTVVSSPAIGSDGTLYIGSQDRKLYAIETGAGGLADSPWPMYRADVGHTGTSQVTPPPSINATVTGIVTDTNGAPLSALIIASSADFITGTFAASDGSFTLNNLPPGAYTLKGYKGGYFSTEINVDLVPGQILNFDAQLEPR